MKICLIGSTGHWSLPFEALAGNKTDRIIGIAPGSKGETMDEPARSCARIGHAPKLFRNHLEMLDTLKPDVVSIACRFDDHARTAISALERGCHVFMEKPVALTLSDLARLEKAHAKAETHIAAMLALRYDPAFLAAWQAVKKGAIGEARLLTAQKSYKLGKRPYFYKKRETYGGTIPWVGIHGIDLLAWFAGIPFRTVLAAHSRKGNRDHGELEATAVCCFTFDGGVAATLNIDYLRPSTATTHGDDRIRVAGTEGVIEVREGRVFLTNERQRGTRELKTVISRCFFEDFLKQIKGKGRCLVSAQDTFAMTRACLLARKSADEGRLIRF
jgi:predicted dehydrogenase